MSAPGALPITLEVLDRLERVRRRLRSQAGFGVIELVIAMAVMLVGVLAVYGLLVSGLLALQRASTETTAAALADAELEGFRAVLYDAIVLDAADVTGAPSPYSADAAYRAPGTVADTAVTCAAPGCSAYEASKTETGADGEAYRVDTYVTWQTTESETSPPTPGRLVKRVTIVVRDQSDPSTERARVTSSFDETTGRAG